MTNNFTDLTKQTLNREVNGTCQECLHNLYLMVDGEATKEQEIYFQKHMDECIPCFDSYNLEKSVKQFLSSRIERKPVPQSVIDTIKSNIASFI